MTSRRYLKRPYHEEVISNFSKSSDDLGSKGVCYCHVIASLLAQEQLYSLPKHASTPGKRAQGNPYYERYRDDGSPSQSQLSHSSVSGALNP